MRKVALALFDMHDVLCRYDQKKRLADLARLSGKPADAIYAEIWQSGFEAEADAGRLDAQAYLAGFGERLGYPITLEEWLENRRSSIEPIPGALDLMAAVKAKAEASVAVLTNNHTLVRDHLDVLFPQLHALARERCYVSAQFGAIKPDPEVYLRCVAAAGALPAETLFIDDARKNVDGAVAAGLFGHLFTDIARLRAALSDAGLI
jgi:putative hydrolase of the HAD superfamily